MAPTLALLLLSVAAASSASVSSTSAEEPWRAWVAPRNGGVGAAGAASGRDLEVGVAIGVPPGSVAAASDVFSPATGAVAAPAQAAAPVVYSSPGWYTIPPQRFETPGLLSAILRGPSAASTAPLQAFKPVQPLQQFQTLQPIQSMPNLQPLQPLQTIRPMQTLQPQQIFVQPAQSYQVPEWRLVPLERAEVPVGAASSVPGAEWEPAVFPRGWEPAAAPPPLPLLREPTGGKLLAPTPLSQRRVGAFRLRSDRGYQLLMEVPPATAGPGAPADGVLVMEMRATLYRPVS